MRVEATDPKPTPELQLPSMMRAILDAEETRAIGIPPADALYAYVVALIPAGV
jgi:hypothetical protein